MIYCIFAFSFVAAAMSCATFWYVWRGAVKKGEEQPVQQEIAEPKDEALDAFEKRYASGMKNILAYEFKDARKAVNAYGEDE